MKNKLTYILLTLMLLAPMVVSAKYLYIKPSSNWQEANAKFYAWAWADGQGGSWVHFANRLPVSDVVYYAEVADNINNLILVRVDPSASPDLGNNWAKTIDLNNIGSNNCFANSGWDTNFAWSTMPTYSFTVKFHNNKSWANVYMHAWGPGTENRAWDNPIQLTKDADGWYTYSFTNAIPGIIFHNNAGSQTGDITGKTSDMCVELTSDGKGVKDIDCNLSFVVASVSLDKTELELAPGASYTLTAIVLPASAENKNVTWKSSNESVATVVNGNIIVNETAADKANATITVTTEDGGKTATCVVTVSKPATLVSTITLSPSSLALETGDEATITATISPDDASNKNLTWSSTDATIAKYEGGKIKALKVGTATITASATDGSGKSASCVVTVTEKKYTYTVKFHNNGYWDEVCFYAWYEGGATISKDWPGDKVTKDANGWYTYTFTNVTTDAHFIVNNNDNGKQTVNISGITADACIELDNPNASSSYAIKQGIDCEQVFKTYYYLEGYINGADYTGTDYAFDESGSITITFTETSYIYIKSSENKVYDVAKYVDWISAKTGTTSLVKKEVKEKIGVMGGVPLTFTVAPQDDGSLTLSYSRDEILPESVTLNETTLNLNPGGTATLTATVLPETADDKTITWSTSNSAVATVTDGKVTAVAEGTAVITAKTKNGKTVTCDVTVKEEVRLSTKVSISATSAKVKIGSTVTLTAAADGTNTAVTWTTSNATIASVVDGVVIGNAKGSATITATAADGSGKSASCEVKVLNKYTFTINLYDKNNDWAQGYQYIYGSVDQHDTWPGATTGTSSIVDGLRWWSFTFTDIDEDASFILHNNKNDKDGDKTTDLTVAANHTTGDYIMQDGLLKPFVHVESISLSDLTLDVKGTATLSATFTPDNATVKTIKWTSSNPEFVKIDENTGAITAIKPGESTITATTIEGGKTATCKVTVQGYDFTIYAKTPWTTTTKIYAFYSDGNGTEERPAGDWSGTPMTTKDGWFYYEFKNQPSLTIIFNNGSGAQTANIEDVKTDTWYVVNDDKTYTPYSKETFNSIELPASVGIIKGKTATITATTDPVLVDKAKDLIKWSSDAQTIATVDADGVVTANAAGTATITATVLGKSATCTVTVYDNAAPGISVAKVTGVTGDGSVESPFVLYKGKEFNFTITGGNGGENDFMYIEYTDDKGVKTTVNKTTETISFTPDALTNEKQKLLAEAYIKIDEKESTRAKRDIYYEVHPDPTIGLDVPEVAEVGSQMYYKVLTDVNVADNAEIFTFETWVSDGPHDIRDNVSRYFWYYNYGMSSVNETYHAKVSMNYGGYTWTSRQYNIECKNTLQSPYYAYVGYPLTIVPAVDVATASTYTIDDPSVITASTTADLYKVVTPLKEGETTVKMSFTAPALSGTGTVSVLGEKEVIVKVLSTPENHILVRVNVSQVPWDWSKIELHYWGNGIDKNKYLDTRNEGNGWFSAFVPLGDDGEVNFLVKEKWQESTDTGGSEYFSLNVEHVSESGCWIVKSDQYKQDGNEHHNKRIIEATDECALYTRVISYVIENSDKVTYYSNNVCKAGETLSYFTLPEHTRILQHHNNVRWVDIATIPANAIATDTHSGVQVTTLGSDCQSLTEHSIYNGDYYIQTNRAFGQGSKWLTYKNMNSEQRDSARLTYFAPVDEFKDRFNYYWVEWYGRSGSADNHRTESVRARIGNIYNEKITNILHNDDNTTPDGLLKSGHNASVRFGYNPKNNQIIRDMIEPATTTNSNFLILYSTTPERLTTTTDTPPVELAEDCTMSYFTDASNWCYDMDVYAKPDETQSSGVEVVVRAVYADQANYLFGRTPTFINGVQVQVPNTRTLLGATSTMSTNPDGYHMRVIYDFKTNRIIGGWLPQDETITEDKVINANMVITRVEDNPATQITLSNEDVEVSGLKEIYTVLEISKDNWDKNGGFFWFSLPYECNIKDIFGINKYGSKKTDKWVIQRYRGDKRAELGLYLETPTFWYNMKRTATLEAGRGYVLYLNLDDDDFKDVTINGVSKSVLRLYFPSKQSGFTLKKETKTSTVPAHIRTATRDVESNSNWNVIGLPGYKNMTINTWTPKAEEPKPMKDGFFYNWEWKDNKGVYTVKTSREVPEFKTTFAYMVQFGGVIEWIETSTVPKGVLAKNSNETDKLLKLTIQDSISSDNTYIQLTEGATTDYDLNVDMGKIVNSGIPQIWSIVGKDNSQLAANSLPFDNHVVKLGVQAAQDGKYTFSIASIPAGVKPVLVDKIAGKKIDLIFDTYTVELAVGTYEERFELEVSYSPQTVTDLNETVQTAEWTVSQVGGELLVSGAESEKELKMYDALGRLLYSSDNIQAPIPVPQTGVYLIAIGEHVQRVFVR